MDAAAFFDHTSSESGTDFTCGVQNSATDGSCTEDATPNAQGFNNLEGIAQIGDKLIVSDQVNNRFMIFDQAPKK
jgi:hypothetical protein